jgi:lipoate-protein ligase B
MEYGAAFALQRALARQRDENGIPDLLLFVEHDPVITLGRRGSRDDILVPPDELERRGLTVHETNRGGLVTYHGPGQVVGYPIGRLRELAGDAPTYVWRLEETIVRALADLGIICHRDPCHRGVFTDGGKIAAIGVAVSHGVTMHGFAVNVHPDLSHFALIDPCGIGDRGVTSAERLLGRTLDMADLRRGLTFRFGQVFERAVESAPMELLQRLRRPLAQYPERAQRPPA